MNFRGKVLDGQGHVLLGEVAGTLDSDPAGTGVQLRRSKPCWLS